MYDFNKIPFIGILFLVLISYVLSKVIIPSEYSKSELKIEKRDSNPYWIDTCDPYWIDTHGGNDAYSENCKNKKKEGDDIGKKCSDKGIIGTCVDTHNTKCNIILASATCSGPDNIECCIELSNNNHGGDDQTNPGGDNVNKDDDSQCIKQGGTCMNPDDCKGKGSVVPGLCSGGDDNKCCVPNKDDDSQCTKQGGTCMNPDDCKGKGSVVPGLCSGGDDNKCCVPNKDDDSQCTKQGGTCMNPDDCKGKGSVVPGLCSGGDDNKCCVPNKDDDSQCTKQGGTCMNPDDCKGKGSVVPGLCSGGDENKCCVPNKDDDSQCIKQGGTCMNPDDCKGKGSVVPGLCSGGDENKCCVPNKDDDSQCIKQGGTCMNPDDCKGKGSVVPGLCSGGDDNKCCVPNKDDDSQCTKQGGTCMNPNNCKGEGSVIRDLCSSSSNYKCCLTKTVKDDFLVTKFENVVKVFLAMKYKLQNEYYETFKTPFFFTGVQNEMFLEALKIIRSKKSEGKAYVIEFTITTSTIYGMNQAYIKSISIYESDTKNDKIYFSSTTLKGKSIVTQSVDKQGLGKIINSSYDSTGTVTLGNVKSLIGKLDSRTSLSASNLEGVTVPTEEVFDDDNINFLSMNVNTASIGGFFLDMKKDDHGVYHADFDCWQRIGGYNDLYDLIFDTFTDMARNKVEFSYDGKGYALWAWKGNYINLGAGTELGFYYRNGVFDKLDFDLYGIDENRYYMPMSVKLYMNHGLIVNYSNEKSWWLTSFNPNYLGVKASQLTSEFTVTFDIGRGSKYHDEKFNDEMYKTFCNAIESRKGVDESKWVCHHDAKRTATLVF